MHKIKAALSGLKDTHASEFWTVWSGIIIKVLCLYVPACGVISTVSGKIGFPSAEAMVAVLLTIGASRMVKKAAIAAAPPVVTKLPVILLLLSLGLVSNSQAANVDMLLGASDQLPGSGADVAYAIGFDVPVTKTLGLAARLSHINGDDGAYQTGLQLTGEYGFKTKGPFDPYLAAGAGLSWSHEDEAVIITPGKRPAHCWSGCPASAPTAKLTGGEESHLSILAGAGFNVMTGKDWGFQVEALYALPVESGVDGGLIGTVGVSYRLP